MSNASEKLREYHATLSELAKRRRENVLANYAPYPKQLEFHAMGASKRERMFLAGNQLGKSLCASREAAFHATGKYPSWWTGRRFDGPTLGWALGVTGEQTRDVCQRLLIGPLGARGTGAIPKECIIEERLGRGVADSVDTITVRHVSGGTSTVQLKSYEKGSAKLAGASCDYVWCDEEAPAEEYAELLARITARSGIIFSTLTPLLGMSRVVSRFISEPSESRGVVTMTIADVGHISESEREEIIAGYPEHEREARARGVPMLGSGKIFPVPEASISCDPFPIPEYWPRIAGIDLGYEHPAAAAWLAWDRDADIVYLTDCFKMSKATIATIASAIRARGAEMPIAYPHDSFSHDRTSGDTFAALFKKEGLNMLDEHATFEDGGYSLEAGLALMLDRMHSGRFKVFSHLADFFSEFRLYHRKDGLVVKEQDDIISAVRYGLMMLRAARSGVSGRGNRPARIADGVGGDPFEKDNASDNARTTMHKFQTAADIRAWRERPKNTAPRVARFANHINDNPFQGD
ncbi:MAG: terminase large subunit [Sulfuricaulis sp.]|nr:terminase large subunit [Sulfuricaulis sp.]